MNKRDFIKSMTGASIGLATLSAMPSIAEAVEGFVPETVTPTERRKSRYPNVPLLTQDGKVVRFYDDLIKDKTVLINFMYARCADYCPGMTANLKKVYKEFGDRMGKDVFMYSISLDPEHDTPEVLKSYTEVFKTGPGWTFLTGRKNDVERLRQGLGFVNKDPELDKDRTRHTGMVKYGYEPLERWAGVPALTNPKYIAEYVRWIEPKGSRPKLAELVG